MVGHHANGPNELSLIPLRANGIRQSRAIRTKSPLPLAIVRRRARGPRRGVGPIRPFRTGPAADDRTLDTDRPWGWPRWGNEETDRVSLGATEERCRRRVGREDRGDHGDRDRRRHVRRAPGHRCHADDGRTGRAAHEGRLDGRPPRRRQPLHRHLVGVAVGRPAALPHGRPRAQPLRLRVHRRPVPGGECAGPDPRRVAHRPGRPSQVDRVRRLRPLGRHEGRPHPAPRLHGDHRGDHGGPPRQGRAHRAARRDDRRLDPRGRAGSGLRRPPRARHDRRRHRPAARLRHPLLRAERLHLRVRRLLRGRDDRARAPRPHGPRPAAPSCGEGREGREP